VEEQTIQWPKYLRGNPFGIFVIVLSVLPLTASGYRFGILAIELFVFRLTASGYPFGILVIEYPGLIICLSFK
jgi:hypothetical protein